jgi:phosphohistidine phosphatase
MSRELLLLRHAKSAWNTDAATDFDRPLSGRGRKAAKRMGRWAAAHGLAPDCVISSPALRARSTAKRFCAALEADVAELRWEPRLYEATVAALLDVAAEAPVVRRVMLVGHNPGLEDFVLHLAATPPAMSPGGKLMPTASLACIELPDDWTSLRPGAGIVRAIVRPRELRSE